VFVCVCVCSSRLRNELDKCTSMRCVKARRHTKSGWANLLYARDFEALAAVQLGPFALPGYYVM